MVEWSLLAEKKILFDLQPFLLLRVKLESMAVQPCRAKKNCFLNPVMEIVTPLNKEASVRVEVKTMLSIRLSPFRSIMIVSIGGGASWFVFA